MTNDITTQTSGSLQTYAFSNAQAFEAAQRMATALSKSKLVPKEYQDNLPNAIVALEVAQRIGASPLMVMQNLYIVHGRPAWSAQFIIAAINSCGRFTPLRFDMKGEGDKRECTAWAEDKKGERLEGAPVSISLAKAEGWYDKNGSKWKTMSEVMLRYRAASFFGRLYAPDVLMGMYSADEVEDLGLKDITPPPISPILCNINEAIKAEMTKPAVTVPEQQVITIQDAVDDIGNIPTLEGLEFKFNNLSPLFKDTPEMFAQLVNARDQRKAALSPKRTLAEMMKEKDALPV